MIIALIFALSTFVIVYASTFKDDFKDEDLAAASPFIVGLFLITILILIITNM